MLRITKLTDYALVLMVQLAHSTDRHLSAQQLGQDLGLPLPTVASLLKRLTKSGLTRSIRGGSGGYSLMRPPQTISVLDIITAIEGPVAITECALGTGNCAIELTCSTQAQWQSLNTAMRHVMAAMRLTDMVAPPVRTLSLQNPLLSSAGEGSV